MIVERLLKEGKCLGEVVRQLGISRRMVYKWLARYRAGGEAALYNSPSRPKRSPRRMSAWGPSPR